LEEKFQAQQCQLFSLFEVVMQLKTKLERLAKKSKQKTRRRRS
jgi:hypothetical protein